MVNPYLSKSICLPALSTLYSSIHIYIPGICFVTTELSCRQSCVPKCWPTRHIPLRQSRPCKPRACFRFRPSLRVDPFLRWPALNSFSSTHRFQLGKILSTNLYGSSIYNTRSYNWNMRSSWGKWAVYISERRGMRAHQHHNHCNMRSWTNHFQRIWGHHEG